MQMTDAFERAPHNPADPNPWLALYLDMSLPLSDEVKAALLANSGSKSRQFLLPLIRPCAKLTIMAFQVLKIFIPNRFTSSKFLHKLIRWGIVVHGIVDGFCQTVCKISCYNIHKLMLNSVDCWTVC